MYVDTLPTNYRSSDCTRPSCLDRDLSTSPRSEESKGSPSEEDGSALPCCGLREVRLLASGHSLRAVLAPAQRHSATKGASRDLKYLISGALIVSEPAIAAGADVVVVIKQVHIVVQITEERVLLRITALRSTESACVSSFINQSYRLV